MISYFKNLKANKLKAKSSKLNKGLARRSMAEGFTYVELIVVLSIFAVMSTIIIFNYGAFQSKVDIKNLASDIASKIVEAQKSSLNGVLPLGLSYPAGWQPSYGVYFNSSSIPDNDPAHGNAYNQKFIYFVDLSNAGTGYDGTGTATLSPIIITKGNYISAIDLCNGVSCTPGSSPASPLSIFFKRPDSSAIFYGATVTGSQYIQITIKSPKGDIATVKVYPSGRIQVN